MSYQVIARKYRPQRFGDVVGQEHVTQTLTNAITQNRIAHAYLFCGPRGTGKTTVARIFAKCLNCQDGPRVDFDDNDPRCIEITEGRSLDVLEIDGASNNGVEQVRELRDTVRFAPAASKFKIYIIDEVHMLTTAAFNALLKTLEEPPAHVKFLFATTDPEKVLPTILSRCQRFDLRRIPTALIVQHLASIAHQENVTISAAALHAIGRGADGGMRDAESTLDQLISFCGNKIEEGDVLSMFGLAAQGQILELARAVLGGDAGTALRLFNDLARNGKDLGRFVSDLLSHFRNLLLFKVSKGDTSLVEVSETETAALQEQGALATPESLTRIMEVLSEAESGFRDAASKKILVEVALLKAVEARNCVSLDAVLKQLTALRQQAGPEVANVSAGPAASTAPASAPPPVAPAPRQSLSAAYEQSTAPAPVLREQKPRPAAPPTPPAPAPAAAIPAQGLAGPELYALWKNVVDAAGRASPFVRTYLIEAFPVSLTSTLLTIGYDPEFEDQLSLVDNAKNHDLLRTKLAELGRPHLQIKFIKAEPPDDWQKPAPVVPAAPSTPVPAPAPAATTTSAPAAPSRKAAAPRKPEAPPAEADAAKKKTVVLSKDDFKNDPLIKKALEMFRGEIVEVRA
jgi:DNA polymerase-3 subunit gamma/tau